MTASAAAASPDKHSVAIDPSHHVVSGTPTSPCSRPIGGAALDRGARVGAWRIEGELGRGGMGAVYAVTHEGFGKRAALKLCHANILGAKFTPETFLREARIVHLVGHPGVCDVFATGAHEGRPYLAMERLIGQPLGALVEREALGRQDALEILIEVCDVLGAAHAAGVVHRDLKLDNVYVLDERGAAGRRTKLLDWGVARILGEPDPLRGMIAGTLTYVAPEQIRGEELAPASDVYSLAVLAYRVLLGEAPFVSQSELALLRMHLFAAPPPPTKWWPDIPVGLAATLTAMLAKDPADRPAIADVRAALQRALDELRGTGARPRSWRARLARLGAALGVGSAVAGIAALLVA